MTSNHPPSDEFSIGMENRDLQSAIERAQSISIDDDQVDRLMSWSKAMDDRRTSVPATRRYRNAQRLIRWQILGSIAATLLISFVAWHWRNALRNPAGPPKPSGVQSSAIRVVSLRELGYASIEKDLDAAEAELSVTSEALQLAALRQRVQLAIEEFSQVESSFPN